MLYKFYIEGCLPCKKLTELLDSMEVEYTSIDSDINKDMCKKYNVTSYPTLILTTFINGEEYYDKLVGTNTKERINIFLDLNKFHNFIKVK